MTSKVDVDILVDEEATKTANKLQLEDKPTLGKPTETFEHVFFVFN